MSVACVPHVTCSCCKERSGAKRRIEFGDQHAMAIVDQVCLETGIQKSLIFERSRIRPVVLARADIARRLRDLRDEDGDPAYSYPAIGKFLRRDHSTILALLNRRPGLPRRLSAQDVRDIRVRRGKGHSQVAIARSFGINKGTVRDIERFRIWGSVT